MSAQPETATATPSPTPPAGQADQQQQQQQLTQDQLLAMQLASRRRKWKILAAIVIGAVALYLMYRSFSKAKSTSEAMTGEGPGASGGGPFSRLLGGIMGFDRSGNAQLQRDGGPGASAGGVVPRQAGATSRMPSSGLEDETEDTLYALAKRLKDAGFTLQGVSHCKWTQVQREMFGNRQSPARKMLESIYIECRSEQLCPGIRSYPTWVRGDRQWGGYMPPHRLRAIAEEMEQVEERRMLRMAPEPVDENLPEEIHNAHIPEQLTPEMARKMMMQMMKDLQANKSGNEIAGVETERDDINEVGQSMSDGEVSEPGVIMTSSGKNGVTTTAAPGSGTKEEGAGGFPPGCAEKMGGRKKEYARGVSAYAPLNVPDMPGTAPMNLLIQHSDFQNAQGNAPRAAFQNHAPTADVTRQLVRSFDNLMEHASRDPRATAYSQTRFPHAADITTGDALADKRVPIVENPAPGH